MADVVLNIDAQDRTGPAFASVVRSETNINAVFDRTNQILDQVSRRYHETGQAGTRNLAALSGQVAQLERAYKSSGVAFSQLTKEQQSLYRSARVTLDDAIKKQREYNENLQRVNRSTRDFVSLQASLQSLPGRWGQLAQGVANVFAALAAGIVIGRQLDKWLTENVGNWQKWKDEVSKAIVAATSKLPQDVEIRWGLLTERAQRIGLPALSRSGAPIRQERELASQGQITIGAAVQMQKELSRLLAQTQAAGLGTAKALSDNAAKVKTIIDVYRSAGKSVPAEIMKWQKAIEAFNATIQKTKQTPLPQLPTFPGQAVGAQSFADFVRRQIPVDRLQEILGRQAQPLTGLLRPFNWDEYARKATEAHKKALEKAIEQAADRFESEFKMPLANVFADIALTGGANFGNIAGEALIKKVQEGSEKLSGFLGDALAGIFSGGAPTGSEKRLAAQQKIGQSFQVGLAGYQALMANFAGQASDVQTVLSTTLAGASFGWIGALVGAVVGLIAAAFSKMDKDYPQLAVSIKDGVARVIGLKDLSPQKVRELTEQTQEAWDTYYNGYVKLAMKLRQELIPDLLKTMDFTPKIGRLEEGADFGAAASKEFLDWFQYYIEGTLPRQIRDRFKTQLQKGFETLGLTAARFEEIFKKFDQLDPKKALELMSTLADALIQIDAAMKFFRTPYGTTVGGGLDIREGLAQQLGREGLRSFADTLAETDDKIIRLGSALNELTGEAQIQAARELGELLTERMNREKDFLRTVALGVENINKTFEATIRDLTLEGMQLPGGGPDVGRQVQYLRDYAEQLRQQLMTATDPTRIQQLAEEIRQTILRVQQIGGAQGPEAATAFREWAIENLQRVQEQAVARMNALGQQVEDANRRFVDAIQGFIDTFLSVTEAMGGAVPGGGAAGEPMGNWKFQIQATENTTEAIRTGTDNMIMQQRETNQRLGEVVSILASGKFITVESEVFLRTEGAGGAPSGADGFNIRTVRGRGR